MITKALVTLTAIGMCAGCAEMRPVSIPVELTHVSHISQHFGSNPTNYGYDAVSIGLKFRPAPYTTVILSEGLVLEGRDDKVRFSSYGGLAGPREITSVRMVVEIPLR